MYQNFNNLEGDFIKRLFTYLFEKPQNGDFNDYFKYYLFIIMYPLIIITSIPTLITHQEGYSFLFKWSSFFIVLIVFSIIFRFSAFVRFFKDIEHNESQKVHTIKAISLIFGPIGDSYFARIIYGIGAAFCTIPLALTLISGEFTDIITDLVTLFISLVWILLFRVEYKKYFLT